MHAATVCPSFARAPTDAHNQVQSTRRSGVESEEGRGGSGRREEVGMKIALEKAHGA